MKISSKFSLSHHDHSVLQSIDITRRKLMLLTLRTQRFKEFAVQLSACTSWFHSRFVHFDVISMTLYGRISGFVLLLVKTGF